MDTNKEQRKEVGMINRLKQKARLRGIGKHKKRRESMTKGMQRKETGTEMDMGSGGCSNTATRDQ